MRIACLLVVLASTAAAQTTRYADPTGTDVGDCSDPQNPCRTIVYAVGQSADGDTIELSEGTFPDTGEVTIDHDLTIAGQDSSLSKVEGGFFAVEANAEVTIEDLASRWGGRHLNHGSTTFRRVLIQYNALVPPSSQGGGILNYTDGTLAVFDSHICNVLQPPPLPGGGIHNQGTAHIESTIIADNEAGYNSNGGGIANDAGATLTVQSSVITRNRGGWGDIGGVGGGIYNVGVATLTDVEISENVSGFGVFVQDSRDGGGIYNRGELTIESSIVSENQTQDGGTSGDEVGKGAGIYNDEDGVLVITGSSISLNETGNSFDEFQECGSGGDGGGIYSAGSLTIDDSTVEYNLTGEGGEECSSSGGRGGGLFISGTAIISNSTVHSNETQFGYGLGGAGGDGGGIYVSETGVLFLDHSTVSSNMTGSNDIGAYGGGLLIRGSATIVNSTISGNTSPSPGSGGGNVVLFSSSASLDLVSSTITENHSGAVGGLWIIGGAEGNNRIVNSIIAGNIGSPGNRDCVDVTFPGTSIITFGNNLIGENGFCTDAFPPGVPNANNDWVGTDAIPLDPLLGPLADNGGPTLTHALLEGSVAIENGTCIDLDGEPIETDQRGYLRIAPCDIGAFELGGIVTTSEPSDTPATHLLSLAYPNPFNPTARFTIHVEQSQHVSISLYDMVGREVRVLHDGVLVEDTLHEFEIDGTRMASGIYFVVVNGEEFSGQLRVTLIK